MSTDTSKPAQPQAASEHSLIERVRRAQQVASTPAARACELNGYSIYDVTGTDASKFLQGQFCNDVNNASATQAQLNGYCTPKGRLLALPILVGFDGGYRLVVPSEVAGAFIKRLSMFVMRDDVQIVAREEWKAIGLFGQLNAAADDKQFATGVTGLLGALPKGTLSVSTDANSQLIRWHDDTSDEAGTRARYLRLASIAEQVQLVKAVAETHPIPESAWRLADISAGVPSIRTGVVEAFVPQMLNMQLVDGLSFTKGCYPGQEIVARMQYLGKLKRHMRVFSLTAELNDDSVLGGLEGLLIPGQTLSCDSDENAGVVIDAQPRSDSSVLVLAVTKVNDPNSTFALGEYSLIARDMPYVLPTLESA